MPTLREESRNAAMTANDPRTGFFNSPGFCKPMKKLVHVPCALRHDLLIELARIIRTRDAKRAATNNHTSPVRLTALTSQPSFPVDFLNRHPPAPFVEEVTFIQHQTVIIKSLLKPS